MKDQNQSSYAALEAAYMKRVLGLTAAAGRFPIVWQVGSHCRAALQTTALYAPRLPVKHSLPAGAPTGASLGRRGCVIENENVAMCGIDSKADMSAMNEVSLASLCPHMLYVHGQALCNSFIFCVNTSKVRDRQLLLKKYQL